MDDPPTSAERTSQHSKQTNLSVHDEPDCIRERLLRFLHVRSSKLSSGILCTLLVGLPFLLPYGTALAQSSTRSFQMTLWEVARWEYPANTDPDPVVDGPNKDTDIRTFYDHPGHPEDQPAGLSIVLRADWEAPLSGRGYDWSRIVAIQFDEPYDLPKKNGLPCTSSDVAHIDSSLYDRSVDLKSIAPWVRLWVNFGPNEIHWVMDSACPKLDKSYIDVVSYDDYTQPLNTNYYNWFIDNAPTQTQQLALVPGTYCTNSCTAQHNNLQAYFAYADEKNLSADKQHLNCNLSLGPRGITGDYDGCRVWIVIGWLAGEFSDGTTTYHGALNQTQAAQVHADWSTEIHTPLRPELANQLTRQKVIGTMLPLLLGN